MGHFLSGINLLAGSFLGPHNPKLGQFLRMTCCQKESRVKPCVNGHQKKIVEGSDLVKSFFRNQTCLNSSVCYAERKLWDEMKWMAREKLMEGSRDGSCEETRLKKGKGTSRFGRMGWRNETRKLVSVWERKHERKLRGGERREAVQWEYGEILSQVCFGAGLCIALNGESVTMPVDLRQDCHILSSYLLIWTGRRSFRAS